MITSNKNIFKKSYGVQFIINLVLNDEIQIEKKYKLLKKKTKEIKRIYYFKNQTIFFIIIYIIFKLIKSTKAH